MGLIVVWVVFFAYFALLSFATGIELGIAGSLWWLFVAIKITVWSLHTSQDHPQEILLPDPEQPGTQAANLDHPPR